MLFSPIVNDDFSKTKILPKNIIPVRIQGELGNDSAERTTMRCRPKEPEPGNTGGGKTLIKPLNSISPNNLNLDHKHRFNTKIIAEIAVFVALATALSFITFVVFPQGGSVTAGSMVPILWLALRRGPVIGLFTAVLYGVVQLAVLPQIYFPTQVLLDYPLAFGCLGLAGFFQKRWTLAGVVVGVTGRLVMHLISGAVFFGEFAPEGMSPWVYSALYNGSYMLPELVISVFVIYLLQKSNALKMYM